MRLHLYKYQQTIGFNSSLVKIVWTFFIMSISNMYFWKIFEFLRDYELFLVTPFLVNLVQ